jgi:hypothetical protein
MSAYTKQELDDAQVVTMTTGEVRELEVDYEPLAMALDEGQAPVFMGDTKRALVIIEIVADK